MKLLDTTVAVDRLRAHHSAGTLVAGVRDDEIAALEQFFSIVSWVTVGEEVGRAAGELARRYRRAYGGIDDADYFIAATALLLEADLLTTNVCHFPMLPRLAAPY